LPRERASNIIFMAFYEDDEMQAAEWLRLIRDGRPVLDWDPRPTVWEGLEAVRLQEIPRPQRGPVGRWVRNGRGVLTSFLRLAKPNIGAADLAAFVRSHGLIEADLGWGLSRGPRVPRDIITVEHYRRIAQYVRGITILGRALSEFTSGTTSARNTWQRFAATNDVAAARAALDVAGTWTWAERQAQLREADVRRTVPWLTEAIALRSATETCFGGARIEVRLAFDWLAPKSPPRFQALPLPRGIEYRILDTWQAICMALAGELVEPGRERVCHKCHRLYRPKRRQGRPALLCPRCFTPAEGRRVSAQLYYQKRKASRSLGGGTPSVTLVKR
jgi:hypothetical protein